MRLTTIVGLPSAFMSLRLRALHVRLELEEARALGGIEDLAAEFYRERCRIAAQAREQRHLHALEHLRGLGKLLLGERGQRADEPVGEQDPEERADERVGNEFPQLRGRQAYRSHRVHDA